MRAYNVVWGRPPEAESFLALVYPIHETGRFVSFQAFYNFVILAKNSTCGICAAVHNTIKDITVCLNQHSTMLTFVWIYMAHIHLQHLKTILFAPY